MEESEGKKWVDFSFGKGAFSESEGRLGTKNSLSGRKINWDVHFVFQARQRSGGGELLFWKSFTHTSDSFICSADQSEMCIYVSVRVLLMHKVYGRILSSSVSLSMFH